MTELTTHRVEGGPASVSPLDILIAAAGFEDRAFEYLSTWKFEKKAHLVLVLYDNEVPGNEVIARKFLSKAKEKFQPGHVHPIYLHQNDIEEVKRGLVGLLRAFPASSDKTGVDVSGMPGYLMFAILNIIREHRPYQRQSIIYTSAKEYTPTKEEFESLSEKQGDDIEFIPKSMALEMSENLIFEPFSGYRSSNTKTCLALFAGYEAHRSTGVVEAINPAMLLLMYGQPADDGLAWRLELSRKLHYKFEKTRRCAVEIVPTRDVEFCVSLLERYYNYIIDDYDLTVAAVCSKMQTIASFLFWERYPEVQITFPLPIGYDPERRPKGVEATYVLDLPGRLSFSRREASSEDALSADSLQPVRSRPAQ